MIFPTANSAAAPAAELCATEITSANAMVSGREVPADGWFLASPFGDFPAPDGSYVQSFHEAQAADVISTWNSMPAKTFRFVKNMKHFRKARLTAPIFEAAPLREHPDMDHTNWGPLRDLASFDAVRATPAGLEVQVTWNTEHMQTREEGPLYPSIKWWHNPADASGRVYPAHIESITLTRTPNIRSVPAWTANTPFPGTPPDENQNQNMKHRDQLIALLGLKTDATDDAIQSSLDAHGAKATTPATALTEANSATAQLETSSAPPTPRSPLSRARSPRSPPSATDSPRRTPR